MLNQRVIVKDPYGGYFGQEGTVVMVSHTADRYWSSYWASTKCKVLIGNELSNWIPGDYLEICKHNYAFPLTKEHASPVAGEFVKKYISRRDGASPENQYRAVLSASDL